MRRTTRIMFGVAIVFLGSLSIIQVAYGWLGLSSYRLELDLFLGTTTETIIEVKNLTDEPKLVESSVQGLRVTPTGELVWLSPRGEED